MRAASVLSFTVEFQGFLLFIDEEKRNQPPPARQAASHASERSHRRGLKRALERGLAGAARRAHHGRSARPRPLLLHRGRSGRSLRFLSRLPSGGRSAAPQADVGRASQAAARRCERRRGGVDIARKRIQIRGRRNRDRSARFLPAICRIARAAGTSVGTRTSVGTSARALTPPLQGRRGIYAKRQ